MATPRKKARREGTTKSAARKKAASASRTSIAKGRKTSVAKKTATRKSASKRTTAKKVAKKAAVKKSITKKSTTKKSAPRKVAKKAVARKTAAKKVARKVAPRKRVSAKRSAEIPARKAAPAKKVSARKEAPQRHQALYAKEVETMDHQQKAPAPKQDHHMPEAELPKATFDPTPDTYVPPRGQTSPHHYQSERAAALQRQRARFSHKSIPNATGRKGMGRRGRTGKGKGTDPTAG